MRPGQDVREAVEAVLHDVENMIDEIKRGTVKFGEARRVQRIALALYDERSTDYFDKGMARRGHRGGALSPKTKEMIRSAVIAGRFEPSEEARLNELDDLLIARLTELNGLIEHLAQQSKLRRR